MLNTSPLEQPFPTRLQPTALRLLFVSTPVGPLGSGLGGGVELTLQNLAVALQQRGHQIRVLAPAGSVLAQTSGLAQTPGLAQIEVSGVAGALQPTAQSQSRDTAILLPGDAVLAHLWERAYQLQQDCDLILNFAYDWLPFYLTGFFERPVAHLISMGSLTDAMDQVIGQTLARFPGSMAVHSRAQAETFEFGADCRVLGNGLDLSQYQFRAEAENCLAWVGRIAPEKGIEDAILAAQTAGLPLKIWGAMPDPAYWQTICQTYSNGGFSYEGFCNTEGLQQGLGRCRGLIMTPKWVEAFGNVAIEALACGVPVIAYRRGGPAEIVASGQTGWLVEPDDIAGLVEAIAKLDQIDRYTCRQQAEARFSMAAMGERVEAWLRQVWQDSPL